MFVAGMDIATSCGVADGMPGRRPRCFTWSLAKAVGRPARLAMLMAYCDRYFAENCVDALFYEAGMSLAVAMRVGANDDTFAMLRGAIGVVEACASKARIPHIKAVNVQDARKHFVGRRSFPKGESKSMVFRHCRTLRWTVANQDESDAAAIWSMGCAEINPRVAHLVMPLFVGNI
jgi:hypothetical protein